MLRLNCNQCAKSGLHRSRRPPPKQDTNVLFDGQQQADTSESPHNFGGERQAIFAPNQLQSIRSSERYVSRDLNFTDLEDLFWKKILTPFRCPTASRMKNILRKRVELHRNKDLHILFETKYSFPLFLFPPSCRASPVLGLVSGGDALACRTVLRFVTHNYFSVKPITYSIRHAIVSKDGRKKYNARKIKTDQKNLRKGNVPSCGTPIQTWA